MKTVIISIGLMAVLLTGCNAGAQSIEWYQSHDKEREAKFEE